MPTLLIADDEPVILRMLQKALGAPGRTVLAAGTAEETLALARAHAPVDVALVDKNFGEANGLEVGRALKRLEASTEVILVTAYASLQSAIEAVQSGFYDYVTKPIDDLEALRIKINSAVEKSRLRRERAAMRQQLAESEARYRQLFDGAPDAMLVVDEARDRIEVVNPAAPALFGYEREELLQLGASALFAGPQPGLRADPGGAERVACARRSGEVFAAELHRYDVALSGRTLRSLRIRDVSERERLAEERRNAEETLRQAQKMDALGRLAGGIGHDLGNMLAVVLSYVEELVGRTDGEVRGDLETVQSAAERAAHLVRQMMTLSRRAPASPSLFVPNGAIAAMAKLLRRSLGGNVELLVELEGELWPIHMDQGHLGQVLLNLAVNARDAMPGGGRLVIRSENVPGNAPGADRVALTFTDTGVGMPPEVRARIFEPFFTTKEQGRGTGLGLAVTYGIVSQAGGEISVDSEPGKGTTFRILLPRAAPSPREAEVAPAPAPLAAASRTALVAEDEEALRAFVARTLARMGFDVLQAGTGEEALAIARAHGKPVDLLVSDVVMPRMSGTELAEALVREQPRCRVLLVTGYPSDARVEHTVERGGAVLYKPFLQSQFVDHVHRVLAAA